MRLALQALFSAIEADEEGTTRRALLERRLRSSERSAGFFRRLRDAVDDASLRAPEVFAEESFPDANVVAEYLDAQTPSELALAYEEACWDSPEMLAEVGRCCDILNNATLEAVVAPKNCRRRLYYIAWEDGCDSLPTKENEAILTDFAPPVSVSVDKTETFEEKTPEKSAKSERNVPKAKEKKLKSKKTAESVGSTLAAERSWGRRVKRLSGRLVLALGLWGACYCGWQGLNDANRSETFRIETPKSELASSNLEGEQDKSAEAPLCPTTISSAAVDEIPTVAWEENGSVPSPENETLDGLREPANDENGPYKLAVLPNIANERGDSASVNGEASTKAGRARVGLSDGEPWSRRPALEIPAQNNDVFTKSRVY
ncbi:MAG: hypothetical protein IJE97_11720 [Thermoguttaceae bacterium]|nr:hypothetical protein [Thermoguttaceae bacterium]MBQ7112209.1 hypothetical protein [Thermoguttaceae bacterium]